MFNPTSREYRLKMIAQILSASSEQNLLIRREEILNLMFKTNENITNIRLIAYRKHPCIFWKIINDQNIILDPVTEVVGVFPHTSLWINSKGDWDTDTGEWKGSFVVLPNLQNSQKDNTLVVKGSPEDETIRWKIWEGCPRHLCHIYAETHSPRKATDWVEVEESAAGKG